MNLHYLPPCLPVPESSVVLALPLAERADFFCVDVPDVELPADDERLELPVPADEPDFCRVVLAPDPDGVEAGALPDEERRTPVDDGVEPVLVDPDFCPVVVA